MPVRDAEEIARLRTSPLTYAHAVDQITDVGLLRDLVIQYREAMCGQHDLLGHILAGDCDPCALAAQECDPDEACGHYHRWQRQYTDALRAV